ncbi:hypothetical protein ACQEVC_12660 [Plantactinospora sp. CA-294935]|uniref:hypothetical protein n=1 Tax=Plantactinospora sp. CA-294935 TaxID=3240012 RepID=UPI003D94C6D3
MADLLGAVGGAYRRARVVLSGAEQARASGRLSLLGLMDGDDSGGHTPEQYVRDVLRDALT